MNRFGLVFFNAALVLVGCGGSTEQDPAQGGASADASAAGGTDSSLPCVGPCTDTGVRPTPLPRPVCPSSAPSVGTPCSPPDLACTYGDSPAAQCREYYHCASADSGSITWQIDASFASGVPCIALSPSACPATPPKAGDACGIEVPGMPCQYQNQSCLCEPGKDESKGIWNCYGPPVDVRCPALLPNLGEGCDTPGVQCDYAIDGCFLPENSVVFCYQGAWEVGAAGFGCPV